VAEVKVMIIDREIVTDWRRGESHGRVGGSIVWLTLVCTNVNYAYRRSVKHNMVHTSLWPL
jgi:hypothetical protein